MGMLHSFADTFPQWPLLAFLAVETTLAIAYLVWDYRRQVKEDSRGI